MTRQILENYKKSTVQADRRGNAHPDTMSWTLGKTFSPGTKETEFVVGRNRFGLW